MDENESKTFEAFQLDGRILKALFSDLKFKEPTYVQKGVIPLIMCGKNLVISSRTGSGKTAAYMLPIINQLLTKNDEAVQTTKVVILCPSEDLCNQSKDVLDKLTKYTELSNVRIKRNQKHLQTLLVQNPDFVISTPTQLLNLAKENKVNLAKVRHLVVDEADYMYTNSHGDIKTLIKEHMKNIEQCVMLSATLKSENTKEVRKLIHGKWFNCELNESEVLNMSTLQLTQYYRRCDEDEKYNILVTMFKYNLIRGKTIIFTNKVDKCYRLRLILDAFYVKSVVLNGEMPLGSRANVIENFNKGKYNLLLASDEEKTSIVDFNKNKLVEDKNGEEFKLSRGVDFQKVSNVINFDCPPSYTSYVHRVGRTARGTQSGSAVTLINEKEEDTFQNIDKEYMTSHGLSESAFKHYNYPKSLYEGMIYRIQEVRRKITKALIREKVMEDIKRELTNCQIIKSGSESATQKAVTERQVTVNPQKSTALKLIPEYAIAKEYKKMLKPTLQAMNNAEKRKKKLKLSNKNENAVPQKKSNTNMVTSIKLKKKFNKKPKKSPANKKSKKN